MPYANQVTLLDTEGGSNLTIPVTARLWMLWTVVGTGSGTGNLQSDEGTQDFDLSITESAPAQFSFARDASFSYASRGVGLSIQDRNRVAGDTGWLFRSGWFGETLPTDPIEVIAGPTEITAAQLPSLLPAVPLMVNADTTITALDGMLADADAAGTPGGIDIMATGTTKMTGVVVGFTFSGRLVLAPSADVAAAAIQSVSLGIWNEHIQFLPGPSLLSAAEADLLNFLMVFVMHEAGPQIRTSLESRINDAIIASAGRSLGAGGLPAGVTLSVRSLSTTSQRIQVRGALGAFGGVISKLPPIGGGGGSSKCALQTLASLGYAVSGLQVLREVRDGGLAATDTGRWATEAYYRFGDEVSALLARNPRLAARAATTASELAAALRVGGTVPSALRGRCEDVLRDVAAMGSPDLRAAVAHGLEAGVTRLR